MASGGVAWLFLGAIGLGLVHGIEPGHGWPVAATYALDRPNKWLYGFAASFILGFGHLVSSIAMVVVFFWAKSYFGLAQIGWMNYVAGFLLIALGVREYYHGHSHSHDHSHDDTNESSSHDSHHHDHVHGHDPSPMRPSDNEQGEGGHKRLRLDHSHEHDDDHDHHDHEHGHSHDSGRNSSLLTKIRSVLPFGGHSHSHMSPNDAESRGLLGIATFAFVLGFAHEEEFEIIVMCSATDYCLELMATYAVTVILGIVGLTLLLIAGYKRYEERVEKYADYLPVFSAAVLVIMGLGFMLGIF